MKKQEFNVGDIVTFNPYGDAIQAKVIQIYEPNTIFMHNEDFLYELKGVSKALISECSGVSIEESIFYHGKNCTACK